MEWPLLGELTPADRAELVLSEREHPALLDDLAGGNRVEDGMLVDTLAVLPADAERHALPDFVHHTRDVDIGREHVSPHRAVPARDVVADTGRNHDVR